MKRLLPALLLAACSLPAFAYSPVDVGINVVIGTPPPPPRVITPPPPRAGQVWVPGFWGWDGRRHVWVEGHWEAARPGYVYEPPVWVQADNGWQLRERGWKHKKPHPHGCPPGQAKKGNC